MSEPTTDRRPSFVTKVSYGFGSVAFGVKVTLMVQLL